MSKLNIRNANSFSMDEVMDDLVLTMEDRWEKQWQIHCDKSVMIDIKELREEVIENWSTASWESVENYRMFVALLSYHPDKKKLEEEFDRIWGRYGLFWEMELGLDA